jgi:hypothetical protein
MEFPGIGAPKLKQFPWADQMVKCRFDASIHSGKRSTPVRQEVGQGYLRPIRSDGYLTKECQPGDRGVFLRIVKGLEQKISETVTNGPLHAFRFQK